MRKKMLIGSLILGGGLGLGWLFTGLGELQAEEEKEHEEGYEHGSGEEGENWRPLAATPGQDVYMSECGSCHVPYPPSLLSAKQWAVIMARLNNHYGESAAMTPETARTLSAYLQTNAGKEPGTGTGGTGNAAELPRITESAWFRDEHEEIGAEVWKRESIGSASNCGACHRGAEQGVYDEDGVRIPR
jgi:mono/diheme cytochrome c family protein